MKMNKKKETMEKKEKIGTKNQRDIILSALRGKFKDEIKDRDLFPVGVYNIDFRLNLINKECSKKNKKKREFSPVSINRVDNNILPNIIIGHEFDSVARKLVVKSESGMFKVTFSDESIILFASRLVGIGKNSAVENYAVGQKEAINKYINFLHKQDKINSKPKIGLFKISVSNSLAGATLRYDEIKKKNMKNDNVVFHQNKHIIEDDVKMFFDNLNLFTRYDQPGSRRMLLVGEPGGGKTSAANEIARRYSQTMCVVMATDLNAVMMHTYNVSKADIPTLIILEDAEATIPWGNSGILNFLDGVNQPKTKKGCYTLMTTNFPQAIEPRILSRPGRIDRIVKFGILDENNSILCAKHYFNNILFRESDSNELIKEKLQQLYEKVILDKDKVSMTGAQIKNLSEATVSYAISNRITDITVDVIKDVKKQLTKYLKSVYEMAEGEGMTSSKMEPIGFQNRNQATSWQSQTIDWDLIVNPKIKKQDSDSYSF
jgi:hypothetical protein